MCAVENGSGDNGAARTLAAARDLGSPLARGSTSIRAGWGAPARRTAPDTRDTYTYERSPWRAAPSDRTVPTGQRHRGRPVPTAGTTHQRIEPAQRR